MSQQSTSHKQGRYVEYGKQEGQLLYGEESCCATEPSFGEMYEDSPDAGGGTIIDCVIQNDWYQWDGSLPGLSRGAPYVSHSAADHSLEIGEDGAGVYALNANVSGHVEELATRNFQFYVFVNGSQSRLGCLLVFFNHGIDEVAAICGNLELSAGDKVSLWCRCTNAADTQLAIHTVDVQIVRIGQEA